MPFSAPEYPEPRSSPPSRVPRAFVALIGSFLLLYGLLTVLIASAWGPGNSDELVSGGPRLIPWHGLPATGTLAAAAALMLMRRPRSSIWALLVAALSLGAWTAFVFHVSDWDWQSRVG